MKTHTLSIKTLLAYYVAYGIKDVENRSWTTNHRGRLLIHTSGDDASWPDFNYLTPSLIEEAETATNTDEMSDQLYRYNCLVQDCEKKLKLSVNNTPEKEWIKKLSEACKKKGMPMRAHCIIGEVELVDVVKDSDSEFAEDGQYHWIFRNPIVYAKPIIGVQGKLRVWQYDLEKTPEALFL